MDQQDFIGITGKIIYAISILGVIIAIGLVWYKITGHSPNADQIIITLESTILAAVFGFIYYFADFKGATRSDIRKLQEDVTSVKQLTSKSQTEFLEMKFKLSNVEKDIAQIKKFLTKRRAS